jgi:hypothetical protein
MHRTGQLYMNEATNKKKHKYPFIKNNVTPVTMNVREGMGLNVYKITSAAARISGQLCTFTLMLPRRKWAGL